mmetsp:Transcript_32021/g.70372  ORF Transcript_32021/g.70372 Transcript_32021/m.70372 type:complete len:1020 (+) Transcript_32021:66-3125(+)
MRFVSGALLSLCGTVFIGTSCDANGSLVLPSKPFIRPIPRGGATPAAAAAVASPTKKAATSASKKQTLTPATTDAGVSQSTAPLSQATDVDSVIDAPLLADIEMLSDMLSSVVRRENPKAHRLYETFRVHGLKRAEDVNNSEPLTQMIADAAELSAEDALGVMRIFATELNLVNAAEVAHRLRVTRDHEMRADKNSHVGPLPMLEDSMRGTMEQIVESGTGTKDEIYNKLIEERVEIVLTAHPTEVNRKTLLRKYRKVAELLNKLDRPDFHPYERSEAVSQLQRLVASIWGSDEIRREKPTVQKEAAGGIAVIESVLWDAVPSYLRKLNSQCTVSLGKRLPIDCVPIKFASWIGGDRDGNPNVTPEVTREVVAHQRLRAAKLFLADFNALYNELAISTRFSKEMDALADTITDSFDKREKYRRVVGHLRKRLVKTIKLFEAELEALTSEQSATTAEVGSLRQLSGWEDVEPILKPEDLMEPLRIMYDSLVETGFEMVADGLLVDIIRRCAAFGTTLVKLDIREESTKHTEALDAITRYLGIGSYIEWDETARLNFLQSELAGKRPLYRNTDIDKLGAPPSVVKTLNTFKMASNLGPEALGAYVISQAQTASDVLAVMLLQKQYGMTSKNGNLMRVVPLFETLDDLINAPDVMDTLFRISTYMGAVKGTQEVMVGYSDSAKDAGRLAACWAQYTAQEKMVQVAQKHNVVLTFFHGKGGTVGRGGNPALHRAILSHPPNTINGRFRVTEQGEMITQNFGSPAIAERTLDIYTSAVLAEGFKKHVEPKPEWRDQMSRISLNSCAAYRGLIREEPRFVPYFRQATPELELGTLNIGSRPAKRNPKGGIESLRAIPWTFAWTQTRTHLSAWLGVGDALYTDVEADLVGMQDMYKNWPWFREVIDLIAMILSKTDYSISKNYDDQLVEKTEELISIGNEIRERLVKTRQGVLKVTESSAMAGPHVSLLRASTKIRNPYLDPMNVIQAEILKRSRAADDDEKVKQILQDALIVSINGISQGLRNSG